MCATYACVVHAGLRGRCREAVPNTSAVDFCAVAATSRMWCVVIFFEVLLALASLLIAWFALYVVYRLVTDES